MKKACLFPAAIAVLILLSLAAYSTTDSAPDYYPQPIPTSTVSCFFSVSGAVLDETTSSLLVGAAVKMTYSDALFDTTSSGAEGIYSFMIYTPHAPGPVTVEADYPGYRTGSALTSWDCQTIITGLDILLAPITPAPTPPPPPTASPSPVPTSSVSCDFRVSGAVLDETTSSPLVGAAVKMTYSDSLFDTTSSGAEGIYSFMIHTPHAPGPVTVEADYPGYRTGSALTSWDCQTIITGLDILLAPITPPPAPTPPAPRWIYDYSGDGTSDVAIFRSASGLWAVRGVTRVYFGAGTDVPVPGNYQGDGTTAPAIFRPTSGLWAVRGVTRAYFGGSGDQPFPLDYAGDGTTDPAIFRPASGLWAIRGVTRVYFGSSDDQPVPGYYQGDGAKPAIFRPASGLWAIRGVTRVYFGTSGDTPVPGSYCGSGSWGTAIFRGSSGLWAVRGFTRIYFGASTDTPIPGVYDGGESDRFGIFRPASGLWAVQGVTRVYFGGGSDIPVTR